MFREEKGRSSPFFLLERREKEKGNRVDVRLVSITISHTSQGRKKGKEEEGSCPIARSTAASPDGEEKKKK